MDHARSSPGSRKGATVEILAAYITKNAEHFLESSILSIKDHVDRIIVVDDGSTDRTIEIAKKHGCHVETGEFRRKKARQRQVYLDHADEMGADWILQVDDDEVYTERSIRNLVGLIGKAEVDGAVSIRYRFLNFWKVPYKMIHGHHWDQRLERCFKNLGGMRYNTHHIVSDREGRVLSSDKYYTHRIMYPEPSEVVVHHYSWLKPPEHIRDKIRYYMLRDNPNVTEETVEEWVNKHPYFSGNLDQPRYGPKGLYIAGYHQGVHDFIEDYDGEHPAPVFENPYFFGSYNRGAEDYMVNHWQWHNHLLFPRHQARIKLAARHCVGETLEVGCANGFSTATMQRENKEANFSGYEVTEWGHEESKRNYPDMDWYHGNGEKMDFEDGSFDTVILPEIIEHVTYPRALADEAWRVCRKRMIISTPTKHHPDPDHKRFFSIDMMREFLKPYGKVEFVGLTENGTETKDLGSIYFQIAIVDKAQATQEAS